MHSIAYHWSWGSVASYWRVFVEGWLWTVAISAAALVASSAWGFALALARTSGLPVLSDLARVWVELLRGTPLIVQIYLLYYGVFDQLGLQNRFLAGVLILSNFAGAYISEIVRAGIGSIPASQLESARAIGLTTVQTYRLVILPQAIRTILPPMAGQFASIIKDSSLLSVIALAEFTYQAQQVNSLTYSTLESYIPLAFGYLALTLPISLWTQALERRFHYAS